MRLELGDVRHRARLTQAGFAMLVPDESGRAVVKPMRRLEGAC